MRPLTWGPEGGRPTQAVRHTCSGKLGIVKILRYTNVLGQTCTLRLQQTIYYPKPQPAQQGLTQVTSQALV